MVSLGGDIKSKKTGEKNQDKINLKLWVLVICHITKKSSTKIPKNKTKMFNSFNKSVSNVLKQYKKRKEKIQIENELQWPLMQFISLPLTLWVKYEMLLY